jgi:hypothetical protein
LRNEELTTRLTLMSVGLVVTVACGTDGLTPRFEVDRIEVTWAPVREFYPVNDTMRVRAALFDEDGASVSSPDLIWRSLDPSLASVNDSGLVRMLGRGTATIQAEVQGTSARVSFQAEYSATPRS